MNNGAQYSLRCISEAIKRKNTEELVEKDFERTRGHRDQNRIAEHSKKR